MPNISMQRKKIIGILIFCTLSILTIVIFINNKNNADSVIDEKINIGELGIKIQLQEHIPLSYNTYELTPKDSDKLKLMFKNNYLTEKLRLSDIGNNCIWFKLTDNENFANDVMLFIDPISKESWCYLLSKSDIIYTADLSDEDIDYVIAMEEKYSLLAKQMTPKKGNLILEHKEKEGKSISYIYKLDYPDMTISEVYYEISYEGSGSSGTYLSDSDYSDGYLEVKIHDDDKAKKIVVIIRGYEIVNEEEIPFQNRYRFLKNDLH